MTKARSIHFLTVPHPNVQAILKFGLHVIKYVGQARGILEESVLFLYSQDPHSTCTCTEDRAVQCRMIFIGHFRIVTKLNI